MEKKKVTYQESMRLQEAVEYLQAIIDDLKQGEFTLTSDGESLSFKPMQKVKLEVELEHKKGKEELEIELSWKPEGTGDEDDEEKDEERDEEDEESEGGSMGGSREKVAGKAAEELESTGVSKVLPLAGLAVVGALLATAVRKRRKKSKFEKALDKSKKEARDLAEQADRLIEEAEEALQKGRKEVDRWLSRVKRKHSAEKPSPPPIKSN